MTVEGIGDGDGCNGPCCTGPGRRPVRPARLRVPLPYRTRLRLAVARRIDRAGAWLCGHRCTWAAEVMWRACRMI